MNQCLICHVLLAVAAIIGTRNDDELRELFDQSSTMDMSFFSNSTASQFLRHFLLKGVLQDVEVLQKRLRRLLGDATFLQAFAHSGTPDVSHHAHDMAIELAACCMHRGSYQGWRCLSCMHSR